MKPKVTIITPLYNNETLVLETLNSVKEQTYQNIQHIIVNDGSIDNSLKTVENYAKENENLDIVIIDQSNQDQLNAIKNVLNYICGDYVFILHSDDVLHSINTIERSVNYMVLNPILDAIIADIQQFDVNSNLTRKQVVRNYRNSNYELVRQLLNFGRNQYVDVAFFKTEIFVESVKLSYLDWNIPFWIKKNNNAQISMLNVAKVDFPLINYRVHQNNYINNPVGEFNVINGELRCSVTLMAFFTIPLYSIQNFILRIGNKLGINTPIIYFKSKEKKPYKIVKSIIETRYELNKLENTYLSALLNFYKNYGKKRTIVIDNIPSNEIFYGSDIRFFANQVINETVSDFYIGLFSEMAQGFSSIRCHKKDEDKVNVIKEFLNIGPFVSVEVI